MSRLLLFCCGLVYVSVRYACVLVLVVCLHVCEFVFSFVCFYFCLLFVVMVSFLFVCLAFAFCDRVCSWCCFCWFVVFRHWLGLFVFVASVFGVRCGCCLPRVFVGACVCVSVVVVVLFDVVVVWCLFVYSSMLGCWC